MQRYDSKSVQKLPSRFKTAKFFNQDSVWDLIKGLLIVKINGKLVLRFTAKNFFEVIQKLQDCSFVRPEAKLLWVKLLTQARIRIIEYDSFK